MNVTFRCPHCDQIGRVEFRRDGDARSRARTARRSGPCRTARWRSDKLWQCLICPSTELFVRKDFSQSLGVAIVVIGFVVSSVFWYYRMPLWTYGVLFATALIDVVLYLTVGNLLQCYRCQAQYRGVPGLENHGGFDLETHEKHRQQRIRLAEHVRERGAT